MTIAITIVHVSCIGSFGLVFVKRGSIHNTVGYLLSPARTGIVVKSSNSIIRVRDYAQHVTCSNTAPASLLLCYRGMLCCKRKHACKESNT
jgi:hypothetical protein